MEKFNKDESVIKYSATRAINGVDAKLVKRDYIAGATDAENYYLQKLESQDKDIVKVNEAYNGLWDAYNDWKLNSERLKSELEIAEKRIAEAERLLKAVSESKYNTEDALDEIIKFLNK